MLSDGQPGGRLYEAHRVAVLIPCYNEEMTIGKVVRDFKSHISGAAIYVFDNNSTDRTVEEAARAGAIVRYENRQGKGQVIRSMFREVDADVYVMVDGDGTYPADRVHDLIQPIVNGEADMVVGSRLQGESQGGFRTANLMGNWLLRLLCNTLFRVHVTDLLSGYRGLSRRVVKTLPFLSRGFESETELTMKCIERGYRILEIPVDLSPRAEGSRSKVHIFQDGLLILRTILALTRDYKPLTVFGFVGVLLIVSGLIPGSLVIAEFLSMGMVLRIPSAIIAVGLVLSGLMVIFGGLILHTIARRFQELDFQLQLVLEYHLNRPGGNETPRAASE